MLIEPPLLQRLHNATKLTYFLLMLSIKYPWAVQTVMAGSILTGALSQPSPRSMTKQFPFGFWPLPGMIYDDYNTF
jgi:hypothetical protein